MEKLIKNITKLIARHNCVILPGMGAFLAHDVPASYNADEQIFMPPHRTLGFNSQVTVDDALLLSEYLKDNNLSYKSASEALDRDIAKLRIGLSRKGVYRFGELGTFSMDINGEIAFEPNINGIDDPYNFGFEPLAITLLSDCEKKEIVIKRRDFRRYVAVAVAVILAFIFVTPVSDSAYESGMQASIAGVSTKSLSMPFANSEASNTVVEEVACEIAPVIDTVTENIITVNDAQPVAEEVIAETSEAFANELVTQPVVQSTPGVEYHIIVASLPSANKAQRAIKELSNKMKTEYSVVEGDRRFRVSVGCYESESDAETALVEFQKTFHDAWILTR